VLARETGTPQPSAVSLQHALLQRAVAETLPQARHKQIAWAAAANT
jgi:hypothetical protein